MKKRRASKKSIDKWKAKKWYSVIAPSVFENKVVGEVISGDPSNLQNRIVPVPVVDVIGRSKPEWDYSNIKFRIKEVKDDKAYAEIIGFEVAFSFLRALAKRRRSVIHEVVDVKTKDGKRVRIKALLVTHKKVSAIVKKNLRKELVERLIEFASSRDYYSLIKETLNGKYASNVFKYVNKINPVQHLIIKKMELFEEFT